MSTLRDGGPFMEFLAVVLLLAGAGIAIVVLAIFAPSQSSVIDFFQNEAQILSGAVIALAYAARGVVTSRNTTTETKTTEEPPR